MNIGMFTDTWLPDINGVVNSIITLESELEKLGHTITIFSSTTHVPEQGKNNLYMVHSMPFVFNKQFRMAATVSARLMKEIQRQKLDVIHTNSEMSLFCFAKSMAKRNNIPLVHTYHTMWEDYTHYLPVNPDHMVVKKFVRTVMARCGDFADKIICPTEKTRRYVVDCCKQDDRKISIIPTGIRLERFHRENQNEAKLDEIRDKYALNGKQVMVFVGRMGEEKSIDVIIRGMKKLAPKFPNLVFLLIGYGPDEDKLHTMAIKEGIGDKVIFTGGMPFDQVGAYYNVADFFVTASTSETQGLTYIEAMAAGIPVLVKRDECVDGLVEDGVNSMLFNEEDQFVERAEYLLNNPERVREMGEKARRVSDRYTTQSFCNSVVSIYDSAITGWKSTHKGL